MPAFILFVAALLVSPVPWSDQAPARRSFPKKAGIYAMTPQGPVELKVSGEKNEVEKAVVLQNYFSPDSFDKIPSAESVQSFYVSAMGWQPKGLYMVVGREYLTNSYEKLQRFAGRLVPRGAIAYEIESADLQSPEFVLRAIRRLAPAGVADADLEAYLVLEVRSVTGLNGRAYPIRIQVPAEGRGTK